MNGRMEGWVNWLKAFLQEERPRASILCMHACEGNDFRLAVRLIDKEGIQSKSLIFIYNLLPLVANRSWDAEESVLLDCISNNCTCNCYECLYSLKEDTSVCFCLYYDRNLIDLFIIIEKSCCFFLFCFCSGAAGIFRAHFADCQDLKRRCWQIHLYSNKCSWWSPAIHLSACIW